MKKKRLIVSLLALALVMTGCNGKKEETTKKHEEKNESKNDLSIFGKNDTDDESTFDDYEYDEYTMDDTFEEDIVDDEDFLESLNKEPAYKFISDLGNSKIEVPLMNFEGRTVVIVFDNPELTTPFDYLGGDVGTVTSSTETSNSVDEWSVEGGADTCFHTEDELVTFHTSSGPDEEDIYEKVTDNLYKYRHDGPSDNRFYYMALCNIWSNGSIFSKGYIEFILDDEDYDSVAAMDEKAERMFDMFTFYYLPEDKDVTQAENMVTGEIVDLTQYCMIEELTIKQMAMYGVQVTDRNQLITAEDERTLLRLDDEISYSIDFGYFGGDYSDFFKNCYQYLCDRGDFTISVDSYGTLLFTHGDKLVYELDMHYPEDKYTVDQMIDLFFENYIY